MGGWDSNTGGAFNPRRAGDAGAVASGRGNRGSFAADTFSAPELPTLTYDAEPAVEHTFDWDAAEDAVAAPAIPAAPAAAPARAAVPAEPERPADPTVAIDWTSVETRMLPPLTEAYVHDGFAHDFTPAPAAATPAPAPHSAPANDPWYDTLPKTADAVPLTWTSPTAEAADLSDPAKLMAINDADIAAGWMGTPHRQWDERRRTLTDDEQRTEQILSLEVLFMDRDNQHLLRPGTPGANDESRHATGMLSGNPVTAASMSLMRRIDVHNAGLVGRGATVFTSVPHRLREYMAVGVPA